MQVSTFILYGLIEGIIVLLILCLFLVVILKRSRLRAAKLQANLSKLLSEYRELHAKLLAEREDHRVSNTYKKQINEQIAVTRKYHESLGAKRDITLDLNPESPPVRQTLAIRHAILVAEKEALNSSTDGKPNWAFLETKFMQLVKFYVDLTPRNKDSGIDNSQPETVAPDTSDTADKLAILEKMLEAKHQELDDLNFEKLTSEKRIENLEKFKDLFFQMEDQWKDAKSEAQKYYDQLKAMSSQVSDQEAFDGILQQYHNVYNEVERTINTTLGKTTQEKAQDDNEFLLDFDNTEQPKTVTNEDENNSHTVAVEELNKLRNLTAGQHRIISELQKKLHDAKTAEQKQAVIEDLEKELRKQINYAKESDVCIKLLEDELQKSGLQSKMLATKLHQAQIDIGSIPKMQEAIREFTMESKEMLKNLTELENENQQLREKVREGGAQNPQTESQLKTLKAKYATLEERYLELKMAK